MLQMQAVAVTSDLRMYEAQWMQQNSSLFDWAISLTVQVVFSRRLPTFLALLLLTTEEHQANRSCFMTGGSVAELL